MVLAYWGYETDEVSLSMLCKTNVFGISADQLIEVAQRFGFDGYAERKSKYSFLTRALKESVPPIVAVDATILHEKQQSIYTKHDIVLLEITSRKVVYHDSAVGQNLLILPATFKEAWQCTQNEVILIWPVKKTLGKTFMKRLRT
jgi:ABC-type bacteriocin/lantibiotic exporter with double-glycine peptidase domain